MVTYLDILPEEILGKIYNILYKDCLRELREKYRAEWYQEYQCCECVRLYETYSSHFPFYPDAMCWVCNRPICEECIRDSRENDTTMYVSMCVSCKESYFETG